MEMAESIWQRAVKDTRQQILDTVWYQALSVVIGSAVAGLIAWTLWVRSSLEGWQVGLITFISAVLGFYLLYLTLFVINFCRARQKLRNEAIVYLVNKLIGLNIANIGMWDNIYPAMVLQTNPMDFPPLNKAKVINGNVQLSISTLKIKSCKEMARL